MITFDTTCRRRGLRRAALLLPLLLMGCSAGVSREVSFEFPDGGRIVNTIRSLGDDSWENVYSYVPPGEPIAEEIARSTGIADVGVGGLDPAGETEVALSDARPSDLLSTGELVVFRPLVQEASPGERIFVRTAAGGWTEHALETLYRDHDVMQKEIKPIDGDLTAPATVVEIDLESSTVLAEGEWGYQSRTLYFDLSADGSVLDLIRVTRPRGEDAQPAAWAEQGSDWSFDELYARAKQVFMSAKQRQILTEIPKMTPEAAKVGTYVTIDFLNEIFGNPGNEKAFVLEDTRIVGARDCEDDDRDQFRAYFAGDLIGWDGFKSPFSEVWRFDRVHGEWLAAEIELLEPNFEDIQALNEAAAAETDAGPCLLLR